MSSQLPDQPGRRVAIVGCGFVGAKRATALALALTSELVAVYDRDKDRAEALAAAHLGPLAVAESAREAAERAGPDGLVIVATQHDSLADYAMVAAEAGCHVLIEKPGARRPEELAPLVDLAARSDVVVRVGFNHRFHPALLAAHALLTTGTYGEILLIRARYGHGGRLGYEQEWRADPARAGGGQLLDQGVHLIDLTQHLAGPVALRYAALPTRYWEMPVEDNAFLHLGLAGDGDAWLHASWTEWKNLFSYEITCRTAKLEITGLGGSYGPERLTVYELPDALGPPMIRSEEWPPGDRSWAAELDDVEAEIQGRPASGASLADAVSVLRVVKEAYGR